MNTTRSPRRARTAPPAPPAPATESRPLMSLGRDVNGRFRSGNPGGPGNPFARKVASLRKALLDSVSDDDVQQVIQAIKERARQGDVAAARLLLSYSVGRPGEPKDPDRMDIDEWQWLQQMRVGVKEFMDTVNSLPACLSSFLASLHWACNAQTNAVLPLAAGLALTGDLPAAPSTNGDAQPAAPRQRTARAPAANGRKKANERRNVSDAAAPAEHAPAPAPSTNGDTESNGRHEESGGAAPVERPPAAAPSATRAKKPARRREEAVESASAERPPAPAPSANGETGSADRRDGSDDAAPGGPSPPAPSANGGTKEGGRPEASGDAAPGGHPPAPAPSANGGRAAEAAAEDVLRRLFGLLGQPPQNDRGPPR